MLLEQYVYLVPQVAGVWNAMMHDHCSMNVFPLIEATLNLSDDKTEVLAFFSLGLGWIPELKPSFYNMKAIASLIAVSPNPKGLLF